MKKDDFKELLKECKDSIPLTEKKIAEDLVYLNVEHQVNVSLKIDKNFHPFYEVREEDLLKDDVNLEDIYNLLLHGWKEQDNNLILYI
jgi:hypothetical protein